MFVGEAPGADEERTGVAFVGASGRLLDKWIEVLGLTEEDVYITNVVKCRPPKNRDPTDFELESCVPHLAREIREMNPVLVIPLGRYARQAISHMRQDGTLTELQYGLGLKHPAFYLRNGIGLIPNDELNFLKAKLERRCLHRWSLSETGKMHCSLCQKEYQSEAGKSVN
jgi:uracil-DNA glycosylase